MRSGWVPAVVARRVARRRLRRGELDRRLDLVYPLGAAVATSRRRRIAELMLAAGVRPPDPP